MPEPLCSRCKSRPGNPTREVSGINGFNEYLNSTNYTHVCPSCEVILKELKVRGQDYPFSDSFGELQEGIHYSMEDNMVVFTELYHIAKGYCCENNCRNCAYGFMR